MNKPKILLFFPNTANEGVMPLAIGILSTIAKQNGYDVRYFETSFYQKRLTAGEERQLTGEFKPVDRQNVLQLLPYDSMLKDLIAIIRSYQPDIIAVTPADMSNPPDTKSTVIAPAIIEFTEIP